MPISEVQVDDVHSISLLVQWENKKIYYIFLYVIIIIIIIIVVVVVVVMFFIKTSSMGTQAVARLVEALCYKPQGRQLSDIFH
jgi:flagellar biosynthesis/type III secretory pathway M-ring protein FliF/YscJ